MGCHTWFSVPILTDKEEIKKNALEHINGSYNGVKSYNDDYVKAIELAIDNNLLNFYGDFAALNVDGVFIEEKIYIDVEKWSLFEYNKNNNTDYKSTFDDNVRGKIELEYYSDEPRIGGYPEKIIHSYEEMVNFIKTGFSTEDGVHYDFHCDDTRKERVMLGIKTFFEKHPDGIIKFG